MRKLSIFAMSLCAIFMFSCKCEKTQEEQQPVQTKADIVVETIMARRSVRVYKQEPVKREEMDIILKCGINAPSAMNQQPWELRVVSDQELLMAMTEASVANNPDKEEILKKGNMFRNAPTVVFIANKAGGGQLDCGLLGENMMIAAEAMGIGTCAQGGPTSFLRTPEGAPFLEKLGFSEGYELLYAISFGYKDEFPDAKPRDDAKIKYVE